LSGFGVVLLKKTDINLIIIDIAISRKMNYNGDLDSEDNGEFEQREYYGKGLDRSNQD
jgi:hypothetical protein